MSIPCILYSEIKNSSVYPDIRRKQDWFYLRQRPGLSYFDFETPEGTFTIGLGEDKTGKVDLEVIVQNKPSNPEEDFKSRTLYSGNIFQEAWDIPQATIEKELEEQENFDNDYPLPPATAGEDE